MPNLKCPECGQTEKFYRTGSTWRRVVVDGRTERRKFVMFQCTMCGRKFSSNVEVPKAEEKSNG